MSPTHDHSPAMPLAPAHRGYEYQDLLVAARLVDLLLGTVLNCRVDTKFVPDDVFDDLTTVDSAGLRERSQFKHTQRDGPPLSLATFANDKRGLRLDRVIRTALADRDGPGAAATDLLFRIVLPDAPPTDPRMVALLAPAHPDPGPFLPGMHSLRMRFRPDALRLESRSTAPRPTNTTIPIAFPQIPVEALDPTDFDWICEHLVLEIAAPPASLDLTDPGPAEQLLIHRVQTEVGAGVYPNAGRAPVDVAEALIRCARAARQGSPPPTRTELLRRTQLRSDFGAVARANPVDHRVAIPRSTAVATLAQQVTAAARDGHNVLLVGPPGQGKSWLCHQLLARLSTDAWLVAEHYCYLGHADGHVLPRVRAETVFGSLLRWLSEHDPDLVADQRPRFAADEHALENAVARARRSAPDRPVALVVDGLDHVTRIAAAAPGADPSLLLAEAFAALRLPPGSTLIVLSQAGTHLAPLTSAGAITLRLPPLTDAELRALAAKRGLVTGPPDTSHSPPAEPLLTDEEDIREFIKALSSRSAGNALYATYLCREALRDVTTMAAPSATLRRLPQFDGSLLNYYHHIYSSLGDGAWVADIIALLDFPVIRDDLKAIRPDSAHRVDRAFEVLRPVLSERATHGGARIYHESFARFLRLPFQDDVDARTALLGHIIGWLEEKGLLEDWRAFHHLLPTLSDANQPRRVVDIVDADFVVKAIAAAFPAAAILRNLAVAVGCAARSDDWPAVARYVEMGRSAEAYQEERFESAIVGFADVLGTLFGPDTLAMRLLHDGRPVMNARSGLQMCAALDELGAVAPWPEYMRAFVKEADHDNTIHGEHSDRAVAMARLRGRLRLASLGHADSPSDSSTQLDIHDADARRHLYAPIDTDKLAQHLDEAQLPAAGVCRAILHTLGLSTLLELLPKLALPGDFYLALAESAANGHVSDSGTDALSWASLAAECGVRSGQNFRLIALGVRPEQLALPPSMPEARAALLDLTTRVQDSPLGRDSAPVGAWIDACTVAARTDAFGLSAAEARLDGPGWYYCWLRFAIALVIAETEGPDSRSDSALRALRILTEVQDPFLGNPRACDLYSIESLIHMTIERAVTLLDDRTWAEGLACLHRVCDAISTTIDGEIGGPIRRDNLLHLTVRTATPTRWTSARDFVLREIETGGGRRYYSDLAEYRLLAARLALVADDAVEARRHWEDACRLLVAYGWHKDSTVYEVLDPLPTLIALDPARGRASVAKLQPLCERLPQHTDGRGTRRVPSRWWQLLAAADPCALAHLVQLELLASCNEPDWVLHGAISDLWRTWHRQAEPSVAAALRLVLEEPLEEDDSAALARLADVAARVHRTPLSALLVRSLARLDERAVRYSTSDSDDLLARDRERIRALNLIAERAGAPRVGPLPMQPGRTADAHTTTTESARQVTVSYGPDPAAMPFPTGLRGVAAAARAWRERPYDSPECDWSVARFANLLGYRLIELVEAGRSGDAETALRVVADACRFSDQSGLLRQLADGLARYGYRRAAGLAYTLTWTRARGAGGWNAFGGQTELESLRRAAELDQGLALSIVGDEIERVVSQGQATNGIAQALVHAFAQGGLGASPSLAFDIWDQAFVVIADRAPRVAPADDPEPAYEAPVADPGDACLGDIDAAFARATVATLAHAGRERKRRAFLATEFLLAERPAAIAPAIETALLTLSDPATLTWLLRVIEVRRETATMVVTACQPALTRLAGRPHLTVRALARRLLPGCDLPLPLPSDPDLPLLDRLVVSPPEPISTGPPDPEDTKPDEVVDALAGVRLARAERLLPRLRSAVIGRLGAVLGSDAHGRRMRGQFRAYADSVRRRGPDVFLASCEAVEDAVQLAAAGARAARLMNAQPLTAPVEFEQMLADALLDDPTLPLAVENTRCPRPDIPPPPLRDDPLWHELFARREDDGAGGVAAGGAGHADHGLLATLTIAAHEDVPVVTGGQYDGWRLVATIERRLLRGPHVSDTVEEVAVRERVVELCRKDATHALGRAPTTAGDLRIWCTASPSGTPIEVSRPGQIVGCDISVRAAGDGHHGLGLPGLLLTPTAWFVGALSLRPAGDFCLADDNGPCLGLVTWRTEYENSDYYLAWPRLTGSGLVLRGDTFDRLVHIADGLLSFRDFVSGSPGLGNRTS